MKTEKLVLVIDGADFIAVHCIIQLLNDGYQVKARWSPAAILCSNSRGLTTITLIYGKKPGQFITIIY